MGFRIEMHAHEHLGSPDTELTAVDYLRELTRLNYKGLLITNHYDSTIDRFDGDIIHQNKEWLKSYYSLKELLEPNGIKIYLGCEYELLPKAFEDEYLQLPDRRYKISDDTNYCHISLIGDIERLLLSGRLRPGMSLWQLQQLSNNERFIMIQNHPTRDTEAHLMSFEAVDGYEWYNAKQTDEYDYNDVLHSISGIPERALRVCGSDIHRLDDFGKTACDFDRLPKDIEDLYIQLVERAYTLIY